MKSHGAAYGGNLNLGSVCLVLEEDANEDEGEDEVRDDWEDDTCDDVERVDSEDEDASLGGPEASESPGIISSLDNGIATGAGFPFR